MDKPVVGLIFSITHF